MVNFLAVAHLFMGGQFLGWVGLDDKSISNKGLVLEKLCCKVINHAETAGLRFDFSLYLSCDVCRGCWKATKNR